MSSVLHRGIVQLVERRSPKPNVVGSNPATPVFCYNKKNFSELFYFVGNARQFSTKKPEANSSGHKVLPKTNYNC